MFIKSKIKFIFEPKAMLENIVLDENYLIHIYLNYMHVVIKKKIQTQDFCIFTNRCVTFFFNRVFFNYLNGEHAPFQLTQRI